MQQCLAVWSCASAAGSLQCELLPKESLHIPAQSRQVGEGSLGFMMLWRASGYKRYFQDLTQLLLNLGKYISCCSSFQTKFCLSFLLLYLLLDKYYFRSCSFLLSDWNYFVGCLGERKKMTSLNAETWVVILWCQVHILWNITVIQWNIFLLSTSS